MTITNKNNFMKNMTFHIKSEDTIKFLQQYNGNKSELIEELITQAMIAEQKKEFLSLRDSIQQTAKKNKLGSSKDTVTFTRKLRLSK